MKKTVFIIVLFLLTCFSHAQSPGTLERVPLEILDGYLSVKTGEFQAKSAMDNNGLYANGLYYQTVYIAHNESTGLSNVYINGQPKWLQKFKVRPFLITDAWKTGIFVIKYLDKDMPSIGYGMETVYARNIRQELCDSVVSVADDGFVYKIGKKYYYTKYREVASSGQPVQIVWPERKVYGVENERELLPIEDLNRLSEGDIYHYAYWGEEMPGHYYYLYRDDYMPYSVLVIDGQVIELFGAYSDDDFRLKYSYNGEHWMAVAGQYFWIDGRMKLLEGYYISDFFINDEGEFFYKAVKIGDEENGETIVANDEIIRKNAYVGYFNLNAMQKLTFHFFSGGRCFVYEDGEIKNKTEDYMTSFYEADRIDGMKIKISSNNHHVLEYVTGSPGLSIDGQWIINSIPYQVVYDTKHNCFRWNCIEPNREGKTELVIYRYHM